jgi:hypothetical protein
MGGPIGLATHPAVQKEIGLEPEKAKALRDLAESFGTEMMTASLAAGLPGPGAFQELQQLGEEERAAKMKEIAEKRNEVIRKLNEKFIPKLKETLNAEQFTRVKQIEWQAIGSMALTHADVAKELGISKEVQEKIGKINQEYAEKQQAEFRALGGGGGDFQATIAKVQELSKERDTKAAEMLTKEQQAKFTKLKGKEFDVAVLRQPPGGRGLGLPGTPGSRPGVVGDKAEKKDSKKDEKKEDK